MEYLKALFLKFVITLTLVLTGGLAIAQVNITTADLSDICVDGSYYAIGDITVAETGSADFSSGSNLYFRLQPPANFEFLSSVGVMSYTPNDLFVNFFIVNSNYIEISYNISGSSLLDSFTIEGIQVRAVSTPSTGDIIRVSGSGTDGVINGDPLGTVHGTLSSIESPAIITQPTSSSICENSGTSYMVTASDATSYQWQRDDGGGFVNINASTDGGIYSNFNTSTLLVNNAPLAIDGFSYHVIVSGVCSPSVTSNDVSIGVTPAPTADAGAADETCEDTPYTVSDAAVNNSAGINWTHDGAGSITNATTINPTYTPDPTDAGNIVTLTLTVSGNGSCVDVIDTKALTITDAPTADAGAADETCEDTPYTVSDAAVTNSAGINWTHDGAGSITNATTTTPTYTPAAADAGNTVTLTLTVSGNGSCADAIDTKALTITDAPTADAGTADETCEDTPYTVSDAAVTNSAGINWTHDGAGSITNATTINPTYTPDPTDAGNIVTLTLTVSGNGSCADAIDTKALTITDAPTADAGAADETCEDTPYTVSDAAVTNSAGINWTHDGAGSLVDANTTTPTYTPAAADAGNTVTLTLTVSGNGSCADAIDTKVLKVDDKPIADADRNNLGTYDECDLNFLLDAVPSISGSTGFWTQISGAGSASFNNINSPTTVVTVDVYDTYVFRWTEVNGVCSDTDDITVNFYEQPSANAGTGGNVCGKDAGNPFTFSATSSAGTGTWTQVSGPGTSTFSNANIPNTDVSVDAYGSYVYRWTEVNGTCSDFDEVTVTFYETPMADAGVGGGECDLNYLLNASPSVGSGIWTQTSGPGSTSFNNPSSPNATATATTYGTYVYRWTETNGICSDFAEITVNYFEQPVANAGMGGDECDLDFVLNATSTVGVGTWSKVSGPGNIVSFSTNVNDPNATITVDAYGSYVFSWTENNNGCISTDNITVNFYEQPISDADRNNLGTYDECDLNFLLDAVPSVAGSTGMWTKLSGAGTASFNNVSSPTTTVSVSAYDTYVFQFTETNGSCSSTDDVTVNFYQQPVANAGTGGVVCGLDFGLSAVPSTGTGTWSKASGPGTLLFGSVNNANTLVTASTYGSYEIMWTENNNGCSSTDIITVEFNEAPTVVSVADDGTTLCAPAVISLSGEIGGGATSGIWSLVSGGTGTVSASSLTGSTITATYIVNPTEFGPLVFRLTTDDPDGVGGPCNADFMETTITVNEAPEVNAGPDLDICEDGVSITLQGSFGGSTASVTWSGGAGTFSNVNDPNAEYFFDPSEIGTTVTLTLTTNDPDGAGPCVSISDDMKVFVNPLPIVNFFNLPASTNESAAAITLVGNHVGGNFTIAPSSGLGSTYVEDSQDKVSFDPGAADLGSNFVTYTFTDGNGCTNSNTQEVVVNPITSNDFSIEGATTDANGKLEVCAETGKLKLLGQPDPSTGNPGTEFTSTTSGLVTQETNGDWVINTDGLPNGIYPVRYKYVNSFGAPSIADRDVKVFASPVADIIVDNSCVIDVIQFNDNSTLPAPNDPSLADNIQEWSWNFDDGSFSNQQNPMHNYGQPGIYNVELTVRTQQGCESTALQIVRVGRVPDVNFSWASICNGDATEFLNTTVEDVNTDIVNFTWDFGDGEMVSGADGGTIPGGVHGGRTFGTYNNPFHEYVNIGNYNVTLTVETSDGCDASITQRIFILPFNVVTPSAATAYFEDFEASSGGWVPNALVEVINSDTVSSDTSWVYSEPTWTGNTQTGSKAWWTGANNNTYYPNERSFMNGPCFDLTQLTRPMIAMDVWYDVQEGFDGAVLQYSTNGGIDWVNVGDVNEGINWYDAQGIISRPGDRPSNFNEGDKGWTGNNGQWRSARFSLEEIPESERNFVRLRIAFATDANDPSTGPELHGFAFDNVFVGNKTKLVLVEHFTDTEIDIANQSNAYLESIRSAQIASTGVSDFTTLQYHIDDSGEDPFYLDNEGDVSARSIYYGVSQAPNTVLDGNQFNGNPFDITEVAIDQRSLVDPIFDIKIDTLSTPSEVMSAKISVTALDTLSQQVTVQLAVVEDQVDYNGVTYQNVVKKLMLGGEGSTLNIDWTSGASKTIDASWEVDTEISNPNNLYMIGFVQNKITREIYGAAKVKAPAKSQGEVTAVSDEVLAQVEQINVYPNPVKNVLNFSVSGELLEDYTWRVVDQRGVTITEGNINFEDGHYAISTTSLADGIYYLVIGTNDKPIMYRKLAVVNRE